MADRVALRVHYLVECSPGRQDESGNVTVS